MSKLDELLYALKKLQKMDTQVFTSTFRDDMLDIDAQELSAIEDYDYEKAMLLHESRLDKRSMNIEDAKGHYEQQMVMQSEELTETLKNRLQANLDKFKQEEENARKRLQQRIEDLAVAQRDDMQKLEARWREAREHQKKQIDNTVETMLASSQLLAKSKEFHKAIEMRDKARAIQARKSHPSIDQIDAEFRAQFQAMLKRHEQAFKELMSQHQDLIQLFEEKLNTANITAEAEFDSKYACSTRQIMDAALGDAENPEAAVPVVQHFSPRSSACPSRNPSRTPSRMLETMSDRRSSGSDAA